MRHPIPCALACLLSISVHAAELDVRLDQPGAEPVRVGIFFEDINLGADGGLYPELVKNRSFEFDDRLMGWTKTQRGDAAGTLAVIDQGGLNANNTHFLRVTVEKPGDGFGLQNEGFRGMGVRQGAALTFSVYARNTDQRPPSLRIELESADGKPLAEGKLEGFTKDWSKHSCVIKPAATDAKARLRILVQGTGTLDLDMVSLFPQDTFKNRPNGLRADMAQILADMKPAFMRFPGGCIVEGRDLSNRYQWKTTIGDVAQRKLIMNRWNNEFKHRPTPDYYQSFGLGFFEYFQLCEDIGAEPLPILNCGMACQFNTKELAPMNQLDIYIQDALDLIEFANGPATSTWGRKRAEMGHEKPFGMKMLGVGNEQWGPQYIERYEVFAKALKAKHPEIALVSSSGPSPAGKDFDFAWGKLRPMKAEIIDEHYYSPPDWFLKNDRRYDKYDRSGPKVFAGEFAAQSVRTCDPKNRNNWRCALAEAAFMTGLERNSDVVTMASYAPLFGHEEGWQWRPNLIWCDNLRVYGTPSYYVQKLFAVHRGTKVVPATLKDAAEGLYACAAYDQKSAQAIVKIVNASPAPQDVLIRLSGIRMGRSGGKAIVLASADLNAENSLDEPTKVAPVEKELNPQDKWTAAANSLTVLRIQCGD